MYIFQHDLQILQLTVPGELIRINIDNGKHQTPYPMELINLPSMMGRDRTINKIIDKARKWNIHGNQPKRTFKAIFYSDQKLLEHA